MSLKIPPNNTEQIVAWARTNQMEKTKITLIGILEDQISDVAKILERAKERTDLSSRSQRQLRNIERNYNNIVSKIRSNPFYRWVQRLDTQVVERLRNL